MTEPKTGEPIHRDDNIGQLARRLIGDDKTPPDFTAASPLFDALMEEGDRDTAFRLRNELANMADLLYAEDAPNPRQRVNMIRLIQNNLSGCLRPVLFDFNSLALQLDQLVHRVSAKAEVKQGRLELQTVRIPVAQHNRRGHRVQIDDERSGMMVSDRYEDGTADVMPIEEEVGYAEDGGMPMMGGFNQQASIARSLGVRKAHG